MYIKLSNKDVHTCSTMGADTVKLCEMQGFKPRLNNSNQTRIEANIYGYKAEFAVARLFNIELPTINVVSDGGVDLWLEDLSIDVKFTNKEEGDFISAQEKVAEIGSHNSFKIEMDIDEVDITKVKLNNFYSIKYPSG